MARRSRPGRVEQPTLAGSDSGVWVFGYTTRSAVVRDRGRRRRRGNDRPHGTYLPVKPPETPRPAARRAGAPGSKDTHLRLTYAALSDSPTLRPRKGVPQPRTRWAATVNATVAATIASAGPAGPSPHSPCRRRPSATRPRPGNRQSTSRRRPRRQAQRVPPNWDGAAPKCPASRPRRASGATSPERAEPWTGNERSRESPQPPSRGRSRRRTLSTVLVGSVGGRNELLDTRRPSPAGPRALPRPQARLAGNPGPRKVNSSVCYAP